MWNLWWRHWYQTRAHSRQKPISYVMPQQSWIRSSQVIKIDISSFIIIINKSHFLVWFLTWFQTFFLISFSSFGTRRKEKIAKKQDKSGDNLTRAAPVVESLTGQNPIYSKATLWNKTQDGSQINTWISLLQWPNCTQNCGFSFTWRLFEFSPRLLAMVQGFEPAILAQRFTCSSRKVFIRAY